MSTFDTGVNLIGITDHDTGKKVKNIIEKYLNKDITQELCDNIMEDIQTEFGIDHPAEVNLDDETHEIEIIIRDKNNRIMKCSSLKLFPEAYL